MGQILFLCIVTLSVLLQCSANHLSGSYYRRYPYQLPPRPSTPKPKPTTTSTTTTTAAGEYEPPEMEGVTSTTTTTAKPTVKSTTKKTPYPYSGYQYPPYNYNQHYQQSPYNAQHNQGGSYSYYPHNAQGGSYPHTYQHGQQQQPYNQPAHNNQHNQHPYNQQANNQQPYYQQNQRPYNQQANNQQPYNQQNQHPYYKQANYQQPYNQQAYNQQSYNQHTGHNQNALSNKQKQNHKQYQQTTMSYQRYQQKYLQGYQAGQNQQQRYQNQQPYHNQQQSMQRNQHRSNGIPTPPPNKPRQQILPNKQQVLQNNVQDWGHTASNKTPELSLTGKISSVSVQGQPGLGSGLQAPSNAYQQQNQPIQTQRSTMQNIKNQPVQGPITANSVQSLNQQGHQVHQNAYLPNAGEQQSQQLKPIQQAQQVPITTQQAAVRRQVPPNTNLMNQYVQAIQKLQAQMINNKPVNPPYTALTAQQQQSIQQQNVVVKPIRREFQQPSQQNQLIPDKQSSKDMFSAPVSVPPKLSGIQQTKLKDSFNKVLGVTKPSTTINPFMDLFGLNNQGFVRTTAPTPTSAPQQDPFFSMAQSFETMLRTGYAASALTGQSPMFPSLFEL